MIISICQNTDTNTYMYTDRHTHRITDTDTNHAHTYTYRHTYIQSQYWSNFYIYNILILGIGTSNIWKVFFFLLWGNSDQVGHIWPKWNLKMGHFWSLFLIKRGGCKFPEKVGEVLGICLAIFFLKNIDFKNCILCGAKLDFRP